MSRLGTQIQAIRTKQGMNAKQLAKKIGVAEKFIQEVESGTRILNDVLIQQISKALGQDIQDAMLQGAAVEEQTPKNERPVQQVSTPQKQAKHPVSSPSIDLGKEVQDVWSDAFGGVLATIPIYAYDLHTTLGSRQLPIISKKVEGYPRDKVIYVQIQEQDMVGFRMNKGDLALGHMVTGMDKDGIYLLEWNGQRMIRQIKKVDQQKVLLVHNPAAVKADTVAIRELKVLVKLDRLEIVL